jgi:CubicO group peptidase (beta-lactamase class C family)
MSLPTALAAIDRWPAATAAAAVVTADGMVATHGPIERTFPLASVTKLVFAVAALVAFEEQTIDLDAEAGPPGATVRHLLSHASGLPLHGAEPIAPPGTRRIYSNTGFDLLGEAIAVSSGISAADYLDEAVARPLSLDNTRLAGSPASEGVSTAADLAVVAQELLKPSILAPETLEEARAVAFPGLDGVLPGFGQQHPNDWGLGFEVRDAKQPHWTGGMNSSTTFGHFGRSGTFVWVDPELGAALVGLTDEPFDNWAKQAWPALSDAVVAELSR